MVVVLPAPFGPRTPNTVVTGTARSRSTMPRAPRYDFVSCSVSMASIAHLQNARLGVATLRPAAVRFLREMLDRRVTRREEEPDMAVVAPLHEVRRRAIVTMNLEDLRVAVGLADVMSLDDQSVSYRCLH
jgi:hypothetical protein